MSSIISSSLNMHQSVSFIEVEKTMVLPIVKVPSDHLLVSESVIIGPLYVEIS
jgi:hypothetical protein